MTFSQGPGDLRPYAQWLWAGSGWRRKQSHTISTTCMVDETTLDHKTEEEAQGFREISAGVGRVGQAEFT